MTKVTMPDPVAWTVTVGENFTNCVEITHCKEDAEAQYEASTEGGYEDLYMLRELITTTQAEAYADARVREALEVALREMVELAADTRANKELAAHESWIANCAANRIRALIPPTE